MSKYGNSYSGNNFLEWWKTHYGTDYDGTSGISKTASMTDEDYAIGQQLYANYQEEQRLTNEYNTNVGDLNSAADSAIESSNDTYDILLGGAKTDYEKGAATLLQNYTANSDAIRNTYQQNSDTLFKNYGTAQGALADSKRQSQQNASITLDKLKKYLPTQIKAQGLGGLGVSESSMLQAYNNYNSDMGAIESDYQKNKTELETAYNENKTSLDNQHSAAQNDLQTSYNTAQNNLETGYNSTKTKYEGAKAEAEGKIKQQLQADLAALLQNYNTAVGTVGKDANGKLLVDGVLDKYAQMLADDQDINFDTAMSLILQALHTDEASMNAIVEGFRGKVSDSQLSALFEQGKVTAAGNLSKEHGTNYNTALEAIRGATYTTAEEMNAFVEQYRGKVSDEQLNALFREGTNVAQANKATHDEQLRQEQAVRDETDRQNAYTTAVATVEMYLADGKYDLARQYLDANKSTFGESGYQAYITQIQSGTQTTAKNTHSTAIDTFLSTNHASVSASKTAYDKIMSDLNAAKDTLGETEYNALVAKLNSTSSNACIGGWYIQGLGSGRDNDDIDITIGSTSRKGNGAKEYDLLCGAEVTDDSIKKALNKLATGDESIYPKAESGWTWLHGDSADSNSTAGKLVVYLNQMFVYTSSGWRVVKADNDASQLQAAINAFLGK